MAGVNPWAARVIEVARQEIGTRELPAGSNKVKYGHWYGLDGYPWCAMFVSWVVWQVLGPLTPLRKLQSPKGFSSTQAGLRRASQLGWVKSTPRPGDVFIHRTDAIRGHTGIVVEVLADGRVRTIEGNTDASGSRTGGQVMEQVRSLSYINGGFIRPPWPGYPPPKSRSGS